jgi:hypothetical protein
MKWTTKCAFGHNYHVSWPYCPECYELVERTCQCCGKKNQHAALTAEGKRVRAEAVEQQGSEEAGR